MSTNKSISEVILDVEHSIAGLKSVNELDKNISFTFENLIITNANESHINEIAELWANHASIQQIHAPARYNFKLEKSDWREFVKNKLNKKQNLLLVAHDKGSAEIKGFLYLQIITIPSSELILKAVIEDIYTKPQYRKQGIATRLLNVALDFSSKYSVKHVDLITLINTPSLSEFYRKNVSNNKKEVRLEIVIL